MNSADFTSKSKTLKTYYEITIAKDIKHKKINK